jgi:hypothetical protein
MPEEVQVQYAPQLAETCVTTLNPICPTADSWHGTGMPCHMSRIGTVIIRILYHIKCEIRA